MGWAITLSLCVGLLVLPAPATFANEHAVALDMDADDPASTPPGNPGGCELTTSGFDPNRESTAANQMDSTPGGQLAASNFHRICAAAFQTNQAANNGRVAGAQITFTITGVGRIFAPDANGNCATTAVPPARTSVTVAADQNGIAFGCLYSQQVGRTTVTASSGTAQAAMGTKDWTVSSSAARFIQLCHGDVAGTSCETGAQTNEPGDEHEMTARVTDAQGNPVANVPVQFRETGPGIFTPQGGSSASVLTDADGLAAILLTSDVQGTSSVVAEIQSGSGANNTRGPGATDDQCEQPAGTNNQPPAGNCVSQTLTKNWGSTTSEPDLFMHDRRISIRFNHGTGVNNNSLVVYGFLWVPDGFGDCYVQQPISIQRRIEDRWVTKKTTTTNGEGVYEVEIFDRAARYRAVAAQTALYGEDLTRFDVCRRAVTVRRHRHRG